MATVIGVGMQMTANASGMTKGLSDADKALRKLEAQTAAAKLRFNEFTGALAALPGPIGNVAGRISGLASAGEGLSRVFSGGLAAGLSNVGASVAGLVNPFTAGIAIVGGFGAGAVAAARGLAELEDRVEKLGNTADKLGVSFEFIQTLDEAARRSGTSIDAVSSAFGRLAKNVTGVDEESKAARASLANLGIEAADLQTLKPEEQYLLIGERLNAIEDPARRTATAIGLLGKTGADLLPFFRSIGGAADDMSRFGVLTAGQRGQIDEFGASMDRLSVATKNAGNQIYASFAPAGETIANSLAEAVGAIAEYQKQANEATRLADEQAKIGSELRRRATEEELAALKIGVPAEKIIEIQTAWTADGRPVPYEEQRRQLEELTRDRQAQISVQDDAPTQEVLKTLAEIDKNLSAAIEGSAKFGEIGFNAAIKYQDALAKVKAEFDAGFFNEATFRRETERAGQIFRDELARIQESATLGIQIDTAAQQTLAGLNAELDKAIRGAEQFGREGFNAALDFQTKIDELRQRFEAGIINEEALKQGVAAANGEYDKQIDKIKKVQEGQVRLIENDKSRIDGLLRSTDATTRIEEDLAVVAREIERTAAAQAAAREAGDQQSAAAATARIAQLDQLQAKLAENIQAAEQGFGEQGFGQAFERINQQLGGLAEKALEFGDAGQAAFLTLQEGVAAAQQQARDGILNQEALDRQIAIQQKAFEQELKNIDEAAQARARAADDADRVNEQRQQEIAKAQDDQQKAQQQYQQAVAQEQARVIEERRKAEEAEFNRQQNRLRELNTLGARSVQTADVRTQEGAALVIGLAAEAQDPNLIEARQQSKLLRQINQSILNTVSGAIGRPVTIGVLGARA